MIDPDRIKLSQLRALVAVVSDGSITGAAERLNLTAPAIHTQLKLLEDTVGTALLNRTRGQAMTLTEAGQVLFDAAARIEGELTRALRDIVAVQEGHEGRVHLGVVSTGKYFAPGIVAAMRKCCPGIDVRLSIGNRQEIIHALDTRTLHLAIMGRPPRTPSVIAERLGNHPHVIIAAPDHPLAGIGEVPDAALLRETFIMREEGSGTRILANRYLDRIGSGQGYGSIVMDSNETIKQAVIAGLGIALISEHTVIEELRSRRLVRLPAKGLPLIREWYILHTSDTPLTPAATRIQDEILAMNGSYLPHLD
ncbi:LysR family transcriptional regulator [Sedimentimonas flavescens]|uniref:LysR family transcriptional regulator n=1 Tax=Sedimentimonas flavescens TaxID=2851012 RepID=UPI001C4A10C8|nr:LysR family transcriptional regulator [Sedimentimonas flavescens]MBW0158309.1 LysR family transcriptional regulator [Sedimentimonas flavescens]